VPRPAGASSPAKLQYYQEKETEGLVRLGKEVSTITANRPRQKRPAPTARCGNLDGPPFEAQELLEKTLI